MWKALEIQDLGSRQIWLSPLTYDRRARLIKCCEYGRRIWFWLTTYCILYPVFGVLPSLAILLSSVAFGVDFTVLQLTCASVVLMAAMFGLISGVVILLNGPLLEGSFATLKLCNRKCGHGETRKMLRVMI